MGIIVKNGNVTIHNYVESGATVENKYYGTVYQGGEGKAVEEDCGEPITMKDLLQKVMPMLASKRMWFAVYKGMLEAKQTTNKDYIGFKNMVESNVDKELPYEIDTKDLSTLDCLSFSKPIDEWNQSDAPVKRDKEFIAYHTLAKMTRDLALNLE